MAGKEKLDSTKAPALPFSPVQYDRGYQDTTNNILRQYFNTLDNFTNTLLDSHGTTYLSAPYGAFQSTIDQTVVANTPTVMTLNTVDFANGVSIVSSSKITVEHAGLYNLQWSGQFQNADNAIHDIYVWLRKDASGAGVDISGSTGVISIPARKSASAGDEGKIIAGWNYFVDLQADEFVELWWATDTTLVTLEHLPAKTTPYIAPSTASLIATMSYVSRLP